MILFRIFKFALLVVALINAQQSSVSGQTDKRILVTDQSFGEHWKGSIDLVGGVENFEISGVWKERTNSDLVLIDDDLSEELGLDDWKISADNQVNHVYHLMHVVLNGNPVVAVGAVSWDGDHFRVKNSQVRVMTFENTILVFYNITKTNIGIAKVTLLDRNNIELFLPKQDSIKLKAEEMGVEWEGVGSSQILIASENLESILKGNIDSMFEKTATWKLSRAVSEGIENREESKRMKDKNKVPGDHDNRDRKQGQVQ